VQIFGSDPVYLDVTRLLHRLRKGRMPTGVDRVCLAYVQHFHTRAQALLIENGVAVALSATASMALFDWLLAWEVGQRHGSLAKTMMALLKLPFRSVTRGGWVLNMGHSGLDRPSYLAWLRRKKIRLLVMAHDLIPITHPEFCQPDATDRHIQRMAVILQQSAGIISNSQHTAETLREYARQSGVAVPPMAVIPLGIKLRSSPAISPPNPSADSAFVMLGTLEPRKNHAFLLYLWQRMGYEWRADHIPQLWIIGQAGWMCGGVVHPLLHDERLKRHVHWLPQCTDAQLSQHLRHARALLFPSHAEGYGLPLLEALSLKTPVLANALPVFQEIAGDIPDYLPVDDEDAWLDALRDYAVVDHPRRVAQLRRMESFVAPDWQDHFSAFEHFVSAL